MQDPKHLFRFESDTDLADAQAGVLVASLGGFVDAGQAQDLLTRHLLAAHSSTVVASFDVDQVLDYRGRRPVMTFDKDRWTGYADPSLLLHRVTDRSGQPFLLLSGPEPDYQWERMAAAITELVRALGVTLTVSVHGIPMAVPHTRPLGMTPHATSQRLLGEVEPVFGTIQGGAGVRDDPGAGQFRVAVGIPTRRTRPRRHGIRRPRAALPGAG